MDETEDYIFSDTLKPDPKGKKTFSDISKDTNRKYKDYDNDKFARQAKNLELFKLMHEQEALKRSKFEEEVKRLQVNYPEQFAGPTHTMPDGTVMQGATHEDTAEQDVYCRGGKIKYFNGGTIPPIGKPLQQPNQIPGLTRGTNGYYRDPVTGNMAPTKAIHDRTIVNASNIQPNQTQTTSLDLTPQTDLTEFNMLWNNNPNFDPNAILGSGTYKGTRFEPITDIENMQVAEDLKTAFTPKHMQKFQQFYQDITGKEFNEPFENIQEKVLNQITSDPDKSGDVRTPYYQGTDLITYPFLRRFAQLEGLVGGPTGTPTGDLGAGREKVGVPFVESLGPPTLETSSGDPTEIDPYPGYTKNQDYVPPGTDSLQRFRPDILGAGLSTLPNIGQGIGDLALASRLNFQRSTPNIYQPDYVDPTRPLQEVRDQYAGAKDVIRQSAGGAGSYLSNVIGATSSEAKALAGVSSQYDNINAQISNQAEQSNAQQRQRSGDLNAQIQMQEQLQKTRLQQEGIEGIAGGLNIGLNTYFQSKRESDLMNTVVGSENFYYKTMGPAFNQVPVKVFRGNGYHWYEDPNTGSRKFIDPVSGQEIKDKAKKAKFEKDIIETRNSTT
jgi:hypothetical protein